MVRVNSRQIILYMVIFAIAISLFSVGQVLQPALTLPASKDAFLSVVDYDKQKNCTCRSRQKTYINRISNPF